MGNAAQKISTDDISALNGMEDVTGMDRKELMKEYKKFKKLYPNGSISQEAFKKVCIVCSEDERRSTGGSCADTRPRARFVACRSVFAPSTEEQ